MIEIDKAIEVRKGEEIDLGVLNAFIQKAALPIEPIQEILQFPGGYSNLTYLLKSAHAEYVLRKPPKGAKDIKKGHDMAREFMVIEALKNAGFQQAPTPIKLNEDEGVLGSTFYIIERVQGIILRPKDVPVLKQSPTSQMRQLSEALCDNLVKLHSIDIMQSGLVNLGKPEGYIQRQVEGWHGRYLASQTDEIKEMDALGEWLKNNMPKDGEPTLIHNDYKYDNVVFDPADFSKILAVLDWEMTTVGDPMMDLGTTLSYWVEANDSDILKNFNLSWLPGNLSRSEFANRYAEKSGRDISNILYFFVFGLFKNAVVLQQIYARFKKGLTADPRFGGLIYGVKALSIQGVIALEKNSIS